ncbi:metal-dependent hydrolase [Cellulosilyticum ruminicola]|uniref:metal-dependent hydrolase n=1 Tax=Cellulosilyticum ruminicola TaxID=425254 RepID=UPI0006D00A47|nr:metal-dependent hydrolase [Cellulosilyticum ruminicola]
MAGYKGHLRGGGVTGLILIIFLAPSLTIPRTPLNILILSVSILLGSLLPDIDHPQSILGRHVLFISKPLYRSCGHRSLTHSVFFVILLVLLLSLAKLKLFGFGLGVGMLSHIVLDLCWPGSSGVAILYPFYRRRIDLIPNNVHKKKKKYYKKR